MEMTAITGEQLAKWKALADAATPGEWMVARPEQRGKVWSHGTIVAATAAGLGIYASGHTATFPSADRDFIAAVRTAVPALVAEVERLEADRNNSNRLLDEFRHERNVLQKICAQRADRIDALETMLRAAADWFAKANQPGDHGCKYLNENGWEEGAAIAHMVGGILKPAQTTGLGQ